MALEFLNNQRSAGAENWCAGYQHRVMTVQFAPGEMSMLGAVNRDLWSWPSQSILLPL